VNGVLKTQMALTTFIRTVIYNMMGRVSLSSILRKLVVDNGNMEIGEMRQPQPQTHCNAHC